MISDVFHILVSRWDFFAALIMEHLFISLLACLLAGIVGLFIGIYIGERRKTAAPTLGVVNLIYTIPSISMLGFLIPLSGIGNTTAIIALTIYALLPMVRNTYTGIVNVDPFLIEAAQGMGATPRQILTKIKLPLALPVIMSGIRTMVVMTVALAGIASFIGAGGLGVAIYRGITMNNTAMTVAGSLLIALLALMLDGIISMFERSIRNHKKTTQLKAVGTLVAIAVIFAFAMWIMSAYKADTVRIASKPMTEQYILSEILKTMIEQETDLNVILTQGVGGGTSNIHPALIKGEFDMYPEYTGTAWNIVLKNEGLYDETMFDALVSAYNNMYDLEWLGMYGFNNTYGLAVKRDIAEKYGLERYSDLQRVAGELVFGGEYDFFEREDGYQALCQAYGLKFKNQRDMDIGLKYQAINQGKIDIVNIFTTDGQLATSDLVVLEDDLGFYPSYRCGNVIRTEILQRHPELRTILAKLEQAITEEDMVRLNYLVESDGISPQKVATQFLEQKGLLAEKE